MKENIDAKIIKITTMPSKYGGSFSYIFFQDKDGNSYKTCITGKCRNSRRWSGVKVGMWLKGLKVKVANLIDGDSKFEVEKKEEGEQVGLGI